MGSVYMTESAEGRFVQVADFARKSDFDYPHHLRGGAKASAVLGNIDYFRDYQRLPETTTTSSGFAAALHQLMPDTIWDDDAISILWNDCRQKATESATEMILEQVSHKLKMKSWVRIQNPVGFLLTSVPSAVQAAFSASTQREQARAEGQKASAKREAQLQLQHEQELAAWKRAEEAFEALPEDTKQDLVNQERQRLLRAHPEYTDRAQLPGWEQSFRSRAIRALREHRTGSLRVSVCLHLNGHET